MTDFLNNRSPILYWSSACITIFIRNDHLQVSTTKSNKNQQLAMYLPEKNY